MNAIRLLALAATFTATALAQVDPATPAVPRPGLPQLPGQQPGATTTGQTPATVPPPREPLNSVWVQPAQPLRFQGFPVFPSRLQGLGLYPNAANPGQPGAARPPADLLRLPPSAEAESDPGWPAWARTAGREPLPYAPELALLVRHGDRVWYSTEKEEPFVPLFFHDKLRTLRSGAVVEVRQAGEFELLLHSSSRLFCRGPTRVELLELGPSVVQLAIPVHSHWRLTASTTSAAPADPAAALLGALTGAAPAAAASSRAHTLALPDGSTLRFGHDDATRGPVDLICERAD
ncbi:MAG: hypothetical protein WBO45_03285, partial [Planctomycetota bacterium]